MGFNSIKFHLPYVSKSCLSGPQTTVFPIKWKPRSGSRLWFFSACELAWVRRPVQSFNCEITGPWKYKIQIECWSCRPRQTVCCNQFSQWHGKPDPDKQRKEWSLLRKSRNIRSQEIKIWGEERFLASLPHAQMPAGTVLANSLAS